MSVDSGILWIFFFPCCYLRHGEAVSDVVAGVDGSLVGDEGLSDLYATD